MYLFFCRQESMFASLVKAGTAFPLLQSKIRLEDYYDILIILPNLLIVSRNLLEYPEQTV